MAIHYLAPTSNPDTHGQARFDCNGTKAHVFQITGASSYIDREMPVEEARARYKELLDRDWAEPATEHRHPLHVLRGWLR